MKELISVIVPVYNCEEYVESCIKSILEQDYFNIELILIDDGSTDASGKICEKYASQDQRVKVFHEKNKGVSAARNQGMTMASGEWYSFIDADDFLDQDMYSTLMLFQKKTQAEIVQCSYRRIQDGRKVDLANSNEEYIQNTEEALKYLIEGSLFSNALWTKLFHKDIIEGIMFDENLKVNEDVLFNFKTFFHAKRIAYIAKAKYNYVVHEDSACFTVENEKKLIDVCNVSKYMLSKLEKTKIAGAARTRYVRMLILYFLFLYNNKRFIPEGKKIAKIIIKQGSKKDIVEKRILFSIKLIQISPKIYCFIHNFCYKLRYE